MNEQTVIAQLEAAHAGNTYFGGKTHWFTSEGVLTSRVDCVLFHRDWNYTRKQAYVLIVSPYSVANSHVYVEGDLNAIMTRLKEHRAQEQSVWEAIEQGQVDKWVGPAHGYASRYWNEDIFGKLTSVLLDATYDEAVYSEELF